MSILDYREARELGKKEYRACVSAGRNPNLLVLDTILLFYETQGEESLGLVDIPINHIAGTKTAGRTNAFAANFMPLLEESGEFAAKWANLADAHLEEGIHDPIVAYEFLNKFFVCEGNKRVSVMKYFGAATIPGTVKRIIPKPQDTEKSRVYFDFLEFYKLTGINFIWFSRHGKFKALLDILNSEPHVWSVEERSNFSSAYYRFRKVFKSIGGDRLPGTTGDAFLAFLTIYGIEGIHSALDSALREKIQNSWSELAVCSIPEPIELDLDPNDKNAPGFFSGFLPNKKAKSLNVLYVYETSPEASAWIRNHEEGRKVAAEYFNGRITSRSVANVSLERFEGVISEGVKNGTDVVFAVSAELLPACLKAAAKYPDVKFLNCSVYSPHPSIRSYNGRMYEMKFLEGIIAGALTHTHKIGYIADHPIYGEPAAINAFAKGAAMTDPYAEIILRWTPKTDSDPLSEITACGADLVASRNGLFSINNGDIEHICGSKINWGEFYIRLLNEIFDRPRKTGGDKEKPKAVNYWWGLSAGVFDIDYTPNIPPHTLRLISILYDDVISGRVTFFDDAALSPEDIIKMDKLADNVNGAIPAFSELTDKEKRLVKVQGIRPELREGKA